MRPITAIIDAEPSENFDAEHAAGTCDATIYCGDRPIGEVTLLADTSGDYYLQGDSMDCWASPTLIEWIGDGEDRDERISAILEAVSKARLTPARDED